jgi:nucleoside-diphosphate-sugar epimerase
MDQMDLAREEFAHLEAKVILVTGASGFIGMALTERLIQANSIFNLKIILILLSRSFDDEFVNDLRRAESDFITVVKSDLVHCNFEKEFKNLDIDYVFHAATSAISNKSIIGEEEMKSSIIGAERLLNFFKFGNSAPVFIHLSSGAIYNSDPKSPEKIKATNEYFSSPKLSIYAKTKMEIEELVIGASRSEFVLGSNPRLFSFYGPRLPLDSHFAIGNFIRDCMTGSTITIRGNFESKRSYLHVGDLVKKLLILSKKPTLEPLNIGSCAQISMVSLAEIIREEFNPKVTIESEFPSAEPNYYVPEVESTNIYLGDHFERDFRFGLQDWNKWILGNIKWQIKGARA